MWQLCSLFKGVLISEHISVALRQPGEAVRKEKAAQAAELGCYQYIKVHPPTRYQQLMTMPGVVQVNEWARVGGTASPAGFNESGLSCLEGGAAAQPLMPALQGSWCRAATYP